MEIGKEFVRLIKAKLKNRLKRIILFGSHARGNATKDSDYDILVIVDKNEKSVREAILDVSVEIMDKYYELVGPIVYDEKEWEFKKRFPLGLNIQKEGIELL